MHPALETALQPEYDVWRARSSRFATSLIMATPNDYYVVEASNLNSLIPQQDIGESIPFFDHSHVISAYDVIKDSHIREVVTIRTMIDKLDEVYRRQEGEESTAELIEDCKIKLRESTTGMNRKIAFVDEQPVTITAFGVSIDDSVLTLHKRLSHWFSQPSPTGSYTVAEGEEEDALIAAVHQAHSVVTTFLGRQKTLMLKSALLQAMDVEEDESRLDYTGHDEEREISLDDADRAMDRLYELYESMTSA